MADIVVGLLLIGYLAFGCLQVYIQRINKMLNEWSNFKERD